MRRRLLAALAALVLAVLGAAVLVQYVTGADARARAGEELTTVLVVDDRVPAGTSASALAGSLSEVQVPTRLAARDVVRDLATLGSMVTTADLLPGEQLLGDRFVDPATLLPSGTVTVPAGSQEVSLTLEPQRAVGGVLAPGDRVTVLVTQATVDPTTGSPATVTSTAAVDVVVSRVVGGTTTSAGSDSDGEIAAAVDPTAAVTVTLVLTPEQATAVIAGMEQSTVWLALLPDPGTGGLSAVAAAAPQTTVLQPAVPQATVPQPTEAAPTATEPTDAEPTESDPLESDPTDAQPTDAPPTDTQPTDTTTTGDDQ